MRLITITISGALLLIFNGANTARADEPYLPQALMDAFSVGQAEASTALVPPGGLACTQLIPGDARCPSTPSEDDFNQMFDE